MTQPDNRSFQRVQFFRLPKDQGFIPVWVFNRDGEENSLSALLVDMSESGIQLLTSFDEKIAFSQYQLRILEEDQNTLEMPNIQLKHIWSSPEGGMHIRSGFSFNPIDSETIILILQRMQTRQLTYVRCALTPLQAV
ncbi:PilZ domain-containing protein [Undibacterium jejuense]|uniref:PilZ domain-containing protein n=1 Tax=Undibacterium jejuense TaxID=1344949 RepID=A0A923KIQ2_9BURK|nr:PilZ domain-containing protein [Undibacterium jejuense]MBC3863022.1 PilZ domain-containing protein [Undibacterium jejuense]